MAMSGSWGGARVSAGTKVWVAVVIRCPGLGRVGTKECCWGNTKGGETRAGGWSGRWRVGQSLEGDVGASPCPWMALPRPKESGRAK